MTLTEFLLARIAEEERAAQLVEDDPGDVQRTYYDRLGVATDDGKFNQVWLTVDPVRVLAECEAKRRIVEWHAPLKSPPGYLPNCEGCWEDGGMDGAPLYPCRNLKWLALPHADHPDYREEWRVS